MESEIYLNETPIKVHQYEDEIVNGQKKITIEFKVTSKDYQDITTLLYEGSFDVRVPEKKLAFKGTIQQYSTSITNLYKENQVGDFKLSLLEVNQKK